MDEVMSAISSYLLTPSAWSFGADKSPGGEARKCVVEGRPHEGIGKKAPSPMIFFFPLFLFLKLRHIDIWASTVAQQ